MIALIIGVFVFLFGVGVVSNAAFSDRAPAGAVIALVGLSIFAGGSIVVAARLLGLLL